MNFEAEQQEPSNRIIWIPLSGDPHASLPRGSGAVVNSFSEAMLRLSNTRIDAVVLMGDSPGGELESAVEAIRSAHPAMPIIVYLWESNVSLAARLAGWGATVLGTESTLDDAAGKAMLAAAAHRRRETGANWPWRKTLVGESEAIHAICRTISKVADRRSTVLITGESGTGKEVVAKAIHAGGNRSKRAMLSINCSAIPEGLLESELFGHVKGAFTGAVQSRAGMFEKANGGTVFLDEIGDMPVALQAKLLRVLQEQQFQRLGSTEPVKVDVRVIAATNANLQQCMREGRFREDLFYRLNVVPLRIAALRERPEDIPLLAVHFVEKICADERLPLRTIVPAAMNRLCQYRWPGNVRELQNVLEMAIVMGSDERRILPGDLRLAREEQAGPIDRSDAIDLVNGLDYEKTVAEFERRILQLAMEQTGGNKSRAAELLQLGRTTLAAKLKVLGAVA